MIIMTIHNDKDVNVNDDDDAEAEAAARICARNLILTSPAVPEMVSVIKLKAPDPEPVNEHSR